MSERPSLLSRRLLLFTGKGGVGKSSVVASIAQEAARQGQRPLIVELGHRASMQGIFDVEGIGHEPCRVRDGQEIWAMNIDLEQALFDYVLEQVKVRRIAKMIAHNRTLDRLFRAAPAVREIVMLNKLRQLERAVDRDRGGRPRWSPILVDLDATGHALMFLELPHMLRRVIAHGPLRGLVDSLTELFTDVARTCLCLVTLPLEVPVQETVELHDKLLALEIKVGALLVNQVGAPPLGDLPASSLDAVEARAGRCAEGEPAGALADVLTDVRLARRALESHAREREQITRLQALGVPTALLPRLVSEDGAGVDLEVLGRAALRGLDEFDQFDQIDQALAGGRS